MSEQSPLFHFEISERKVLLRLFDNFCVLLSLSLVGIIFNFDYFRITSDTWTWTCLLYNSPSPRDRQKSRMPSSVGKKKTHTRIQPSTCNVNQYTSIQY